MERARKRSVSFCWRSERAFALTIVVVLRERERETVAFVVARSPQQSCGKKGEIGHSNTQSCRGEGISRFDSHLLSPPELHSPSNSPVLACVCECVRVGWLSYHIQRPAPRSIEFSLFLVSEWNPHRANRGPASSSASGV